MVGCCIAGGGAVAGCVAGGGCGLGGCTVGLLVGCCADVEGCGDCRAGSGFVLEAFAL